jgi:hypothetical protein
MSLVESVITILVVTRIRIRFNYSLLAANRLISANRLPLSSLKPQRIFLKSSHKIKRNIQINTNVYQVLDHFDMTNEHTEMQPNVLAAACWYSDNHYDSMNNREVVYTAKLVEEKNAALAGLQALISLMDYQA